MVSSMPKSRRNRARSQTSESKGVTKALASTVRATRAPGCRSGAVAPAVDVEVAAEVLERAHAAGSCREADELLHRRLARRRRRFARGARNHALGEVVEPLEAAPPGDGEEPGVVEMLERELADAPAPPVAGALAGIGQLGCGERPALRDLRIRARHVGAAARAHELVGPLAMLVHAVAQQRIERQRQQARRVPPVLEQLAL